MAHQIVSYHRAKIIASALFLFGLAFLTYFNSWWPSIMLITGISLAVRQILIGHYYDALLSTVIFIGAFFTAQFDISWRVVLPVVFISGAIWLLGREFFSSTIEEESEREEDLNHELEEEVDENHSK